MTKKAISNYEKALKALESLRKAYPDTIDFPNFSIKGNLGNEFIIDAYIYKYWEFENGAFPDEWEGVRILKNYFRY